MVVPRRNLSPDADPWGRAVDERIAALEKQLSLVSGGARVAVQQGNSTSNKVNNISVQADSLIPDPSIYNYATVAPYESPWYSIGPVLEGFTRTGRLVIMGSLLLTWSGFPSTVYLNYRAGTPANPDQFSQYGQRSRGGVLMGNPTSIPTEGTISFQSNINIPPGDFRVELGFQFRLGEDTATTIVLSTSSLIVMDI